MEYDKMIQDEHVRKQKCCPMCLSVHIIKPKKHGDYCCDKCNFIFTTPALREYKIINVITRRLKVIMEKKEEEQGMDKDA